MDEELKELVKSIRNRTEIFLLICDLPHAQKLLATLLEDLFQDAQTIIDKHCVVREIGG